MQNLSATSISAYIVTLKSVIKFLVRKNYKLLSIDDQLIYKNSGENIESLPVVNLLHGFCSSTRSKLGVVPEPVTTLLDRNCWEEWDIFTTKLITGIFSL